MKMLVKSKDEIIKIYNISMEELDRQNIKINYGGIEEVDRLMVDSRILTCKGYNFGKNIFDPLPSKLRNL